MRTSLFDCCSQERLSFNSLCLFAYIIFAAAASEPKANERGSSLISRRLHSVGACNHFFLPNARNCGYAQMGDFGCAVVCARNCGYAQTEIF